MQILSRSRNKLATSLRLLSKCKPQKKIAPPRSQFGGAREDKIHLTWTGANIRHRAGFRSTNGTFSRPYIVQVKFGRNSEPRNCCGDNFSNSSGRPNFLQKECPAPRHCCPEGKNALTRPGTLTRSSRGSTSKITRRPPFLDGWCYLAADLEKGQGDGTRTRLFIVSARLLSFNYHPE
jgi:hypothetical protein